MNDFSWMLSNGTLKVAGAVIVTLVTIGAGWSKLGAIQAALHGLTKRVARIEELLMKRG